MSEKEKPKRGSKMSLLRSCLIFLVYPALIFSVIGCGFHNWLFGGYVKPSLDPQFIPTAEYLLEYPIETGDFSLRVSYNDWLSEPDRICFALQISLSRRELLDNIDWSDIYINESIVGHFYDGHNYFEDEATIFTNICVMSRVYLDSGLHILEFRAKENIFAEPYYIHRWAIEIP